MLRHFSSEDAAVLNCAALLHDLAMHMRETGFIQLINGHSLHHPIPWFDRHSNEADGDLPWPEEWLLFRSQVRRFGDRDFFLILGHTPEGPELNRWISEDLPSDPKVWARTDYLLIGEFLRRHHGRLAHEIAIFGFPGLTSAEFPILKELLPKVANIAGVVARSHSLPLRVAASYLEYMHPKDIRPLGTFALYHMALLRVGDYLQIDAERAPRVLFRLRSPESPLSVSAWNQHGAVAHISYLLEDPSAIKIDVDASHSLEIHLHLRHLVSGLRAELESSSAVLSEFYGRVFEFGAGTFRIAKTRIVSNLDDSALLEQLPYVPRAFKFDADPRILTLMVEPIYGNFLEFGVRELLQNAVDAVLERRQYVANHQRNDISGVSGEEDDPDVLIDLIQEEGEKVILSVVDKGVGMTANVVQDYFLRAGASFRDNRAWRDEFVDLHGRTRVRRSGRFGVGVFAGFLLGDEMKVTTRHVDSAVGFSFLARIGSEVIELRKQSAPVGTSIEIRLSERIRSVFVEESWRLCPSWYALADPAVAFRHRTQDGMSVLEQPVRVTPLEMQGARAHWSSLAPNGYSGVTWTDETLLRNVKSGDERKEAERKKRKEAEKKQPAVYCNGFLVGSPAYVVTNTDDREFEEEYSRRPPRLEQPVRMLSPAMYIWPEDSPFVAPTLLISDNEGALPLTLRRDQLSDPLPFQKELERDIVLDLVAWCLANAPLGPVWQEEHTSAYNQRYSMLARNERIGAYFSWVCSESGVGPLDRRVSSDHGSSKHTDRGRDSDHGIH
jgi:hypothetical protein